MMSTPVTREQQYEAANGIAHCPAFWDSLDEIEQSVVRCFLSAQKGTIRDVSTTAEELFPGIHLRFEREVIEPSKKLRQETQAEAKALPVSERAATSLAPEFTEHIPETGWSDTDIFEVNYLDYLDDIQVQIDRTVDGEVQIRVWRIGDDNPLDVRTVELSSKADCKNCGNRHGSDGLTKRGYCSECVRKYTTDEIEAMHNFASGLIRGRLDSNSKSTVPVWVDEWHTVAGYPSIDIHFSTNGDERSPKYGVIEALGYRRDKNNNPGACDDEIRLF